MGNSPSSLQTASHSGNVRDILRRLKQGANPNDPNSAPLHGAALFGHTETLAALLDHGAEIDRKVALNSKICPSSLHNPFPEKPLTPLGCAVLSGSLASVEFLVKKGASLHDIVPLVICSKAPMEILEHVLDAGAEVGGSTDYITLGALHAHIPAMETLYVRGVRTDMTMALDAVTSTKNDIDCATVAWLVDHGAHVEKIPGLVDRLVNSRCIHTFEVVVDALRAYIKNSV